MASDPIRGKAKYFFEAFKDESGNPPGQGKEVEFTKCKHTGARYENGELRCTCGASWTGARLGELEKILKGV